MDQDKNITTASIEGEVENVSANDIKEEQEATVTEHKKKNKRNKWKAKKIKRKISIKIKQQADLINRPVRVCWIRYRKI